SLRPSDLISRLEGHSGRVLAVAISPDRRSAVSGGIDHTVRLWDLKSGFEVRTLSDFEGPVHAVAFSSDGEMIAPAGPVPGARRGIREGVVRVRDGESGQELRRFEVEGGLWSLAFAANGRHLLAGGDGYLRLWDVDSAEQQALIRLPDGEAVLA